MTGVLLDEGGVGIAHEYMIATPDQLREECLHRVARPAGTVYPRRTNRSTPRHGPAHSTPKTVEDGAMPRYLHPDNRAEFNGRTSFFVLEQPRVSYAGLATSASTFSSCG